MAKRAKRVQLTRTAKRDRLPICAPECDSNCLRLQLLIPQKLPLRPSIASLRPSTSEHVRPALKSIDRGSLATELSRARVRYWSNSIDDRELPQNRKRKHLAKLKSAAERLRKVLREFGGQGPAWMAPAQPWRGIARGGDQTKARRTNKAETANRPEKNAIPLAGKLRAKLATALQARTQSVAGTNKFFSPIKSLVRQASYSTQSWRRKLSFSWHDLPNKKMTQQEIDRLLASPSDQQDHINALRSLMVNLAEIYRNHFRREFSFSRPAGGGEPRGPAMRFTRAVFDEFEIKNEDGNSFSPEGILRYWPTKP